MIKQTLLDRGLESLFKEKHVGQIEEELKDPSRFTFPPLWYELEYSAIGFPDYLLNTIKEEHFNTPLRKENSKLGYQIHLERTVCSKLKSSDSAVFEKLLPFMDLNKIDSGQNYPAFMILLNKPDLLRIALRKGAIDMYVKGVDSYMCGKIFNGEFDLLDLLVLKGDVDTIREIVGTAVPPK